MARLTLRQAQGEEWGLCSRRTETHILILSLSKDGWQYGNS
jgi:hypothetical protein